MRYASIPGYSEVKKKLINGMDANRLGHAVIFLGEAGAGQFALALASIQYMLCANNLGDDSCGSCPACKKVSKAIHPDVHFYFPTATSPDVPKQALSNKYMEAWREFITTDPYFTLSDWLETMGAGKKEAIIPADESLQIMRDLSLKSYESPYRFAVIWLPERLNLSASNKLLKIIEEPPQNVYFLLISETTDTILPTVLSRTQLVRIGKTDDASLTDWLSKNPEASRQDIIAAVQAADGNPYKAAKSLKAGLVDPRLTEDFISWARLCYEANKKLPTLLDWSDEMAGKRRDEQKSFLLYGLRFFRAAVLLNNNGQEFSQINKEEGQHVAKFAPFVSENNRIQLIELFDQACYHLERYANPKILFMDVSLQFARLINVKNVTL